MPILTTIPTVAELRYTIPNHGNYRVGTITQRCTFTGYTPSMTVGENVPANARILFISVKNATSLPVYIAGTTAAATAGQLGVGMVWTAPTSLATNATVAHVAYLTANSAFGAALPINQDGINVFNILGATTNGLALAVTTFIQPAIYPTTARTFYLVPWAPSTAAEYPQRHNVGASTVPSVATTGYCFGTSSSSTGSIDVQIVFEELVETPEN